MNAWSATFSQPATFGLTPPALQSTVIALNNSTSVGGGSGVPTAGNWLFAITGWNQNSVTSATHAVADDIHSFWRPGDVTQSSYAVSSSSGNSRVSVWYTPNLARTPQDVYVAPSGAVDGRACLVIEVAGLGPWDTVTGISTSYAAAATSLSLSLAAPSSQAFIIGAVCGDTTGKSQAFAPAGWTKFPSVTAQNGTDHVADAVLTSACLVTSGSVSVSATASGATDLAGVLIGVQVNAASPIPATQNPNWPDMKFEAAFGSGFQSSPDAMQWTDLTGRCWSWDEETGIQFELGQIQATNLQLELDDYDGALNPEASPWAFSVTGTPSTTGYFTVTTGQSASISAGDGFWDTKNPGTLFTVTGIGDPSGGLVNVSFIPAAANVMSATDTVTQAALTSGTPIRLRAAIGTIGGIRADRWYVISRNAQEWPQQITGEDWRRWVPLTGTDIWSATSAYGPTPYRGEVLQDSPYAWWPCDDQPGSGGVLPWPPENAAPGNSTELDITLSPGGATAQLVYSTSGTAPIQNNTSAPPPLIAQYTVGQNAGWMFGDPQSSPLGTTAAGGTVTAQPGSSAWTQANAAGNTGSNQYFLIVNDPAFPALANGVTVEAWWNAPFFGTSTGQNATIYSGAGGDQTGQPYANLTILQLATDSAAVAILQMARDTGNLTLTTYNGSTPTSHSIYTTADLRTGNWHHVAICLTTTTYQVLIDGGQTANVSGSTTAMTSAWTWLLGCGDTGTAGGTGTASIAHSGNMSLAHIAVYPQQLPYYRIVAHYWAAVTAFGVLPAPQGVTATMTANASGSIANTNAPDGSVFQGSYTGSISSTVATFSAIATANAGNYSSGPSAWAVTSVIGERVFAWVQWTTGLAPLFTVYTAASHGSETGASTTVGSGESYTSGYGSGATGTGNGHVGSGSGASPPTGPTSTGDTVAQRIERILSYAAAAGLGYGGVTSPCRAIDPASLLVQAATDIGGQQNGQNLTNIAQSDGGILFIDNNGTLTYWQKSHLASQYSSPVWVFTPDAPPTPGASATALPYERNIKVTSDPQRVWNSITITPFSPDGASLPLIIPTDTATVVSSQQQHGPQPFQLTSYLQSTTEMGTQADWLLSNFGSPQIRIENLEIDAASYPAAFIFALGVNIGDVITVQNWSIGNTGATGTYRVSSLHRMIQFAGMDGEPRAVITLQADYEPASWWS